MWRRAQWLRHDVVEASMRAGKLYCYQLLLLAFTFVIEAPIAAHGYTPAVHNLLDFYFYFTAGHTRAFVDAH
jgi:hypothetical protein